jgi:hypothetical protein
MPSLSRRVRSRAGRPTSRPHPRGDGERERSRGARPFSPVARRGLSFDELAGEAATAMEVEALRVVLRDEIERGRVVVEDGRYKIVAEAFDRETLEALAEL